MAACPRKDVIREGEIGVYHTWSRCVQQAFLFGLDPQTGTDYSYRREWIDRLIRHQAGVFAVDVGNYSILSNHLHLIVRSRPDIVLGWSDEEVATRWKLAWPEFRGGHWGREPEDSQIEEILGNPKRLEFIRGALSSVSWFMARVKEPIARAANIEANKSGHLWAARFGARELTDDRALLTCMAYNDLNQLRAGMAPSLELSQHSAIAERITVVHRHEAKTSVEKFAEKRSKIHAFTVEEAETLLAGSHLAPITTTGPLLTQEQVAAIELARQHNSLPAADLQAKLAAPEPVRVDDRAPTLPGDRSVPSDNTPAGEAEAAPEATAAKAEDKAAEDKAAEDKAAEDKAAEDKPTEDKPTEDKAQPRESPASGPRPGDEDFTLAPETKPEKTYHIFHRVFPDGVPARNSNVAILNMPFSQYLDIVRWAAEAFLAGKRGPPPEAFKETDFDPDVWLASVEHFDTRFHHAVGPEAKLEEIMARNNRRWLQGISHCRDTFG